MKSRLYKIIVVLLLLPALGCRKLVTVPPPFTNISAESVFNEDVTAIAAVTGVYSFVMNNATLFFGRSSVTALTALSSDELLPYSAVNDAQLNAYYYNQLAAKVPGVSNAYGDELWSSIYSFLYSCNASVEGLSNNTKLTPSVQKQLMGESKFMRAYFYFYLTNMFGEAPLVLSTDYAKNSMLVKSSKEDIYKQIIADLLDAKGLLSLDYVDGGLNKYSSLASSERVRPTSWAASAMLARVYLYQKQYDKAEEESGRVIGNTTMFGLNTLANAFKKNQAEAIWQLQPVKSGVNTDDATVFIQTTGGPVSQRPFVVTSQLLSSFEPGDNRKSTWINSITVGANTFYYPYKYRNNTATVDEYGMMLRLGEQYLIRAEARAQKGDIAGAVSDVNALRTRARAAVTVGVPNPLPNLLNSLTKDQLLSAILHERQTELFVEHGHRWFDLKRTGKVDEVMIVVTPQKANGAAWQSYQQLYPILYSDIEKSANRLVQNLGY